MEYTVSVDTLSDELKNLIRSKQLDEYVPDKLDIFSFNGCNEEGEDYFIISIYNHGTVNELYEYLGWGSIDSYDDLIQELKN